MFEILVHVGTIERMKTTSSKEALFDFIFRRSAEGMLFLDAAGNFSMVNPAAAAMFNTTPADIIGHSPAEAFPRNPILVRLLRLGEPSPMTLDVPLPRDRVAQGTAENLDDRSGRVAVLHDVTELRNIESRRGELIRTVAHDLRNPLNALGGYADLIGKFGVINERQDRFLTRIRQTSSKLIEVSSSLVNLAWFEAGMPMDYLPFDMSALVRAVVHEKEGLAQSKQTRLVIAVQDAMPRIMGHPSAIQQAIAHLVDNAIQYSDEHSNVVIHCWEQRNEVFCSVADRGIGIAPDDIELIWDRLWRSPRVQHIPGGGVGLTYTKMVIERHGGHIWVESQLDKGTVFTFSLPFVELTE